MIDAEVDRPMDQPDPGLVLARAVEPDKDMQPSPIAETSGSALPNRRLSVIAVPLIYLSAG